jgi:RNA polymerase sigma factor (TIGR02999 family)
MMGGEQRSVDDFVTRHYDELRRLAHRYLRRERADVTLQTTGLVNEAYLRLAATAGVRADEKTRFFALAAMTMRRVLVDHARSRRREKRGGDSDRVPLEDVEWMLSDEEAEELVALDEALTRLEQINPRERSGSITGSLPGSRSTKRPSCSAFPRRPCSATGWPPGRGSERKSPVISVFSAP